MSNHQPTSRELALLHQLLSETASLPLRDGEWVLAMARGMADVRRREVKAVCGETKPPLGESNQTK